MGRGINGSHQQSNGYCFDHGITTQSVRPSPPPRPRRFSGCGVGVGFIEHSVSKFDTLAGVAIKYGVEVSDIRRMNGLVTDRQMFALKSLQIPLPGRHPPSSPCLTCSSLSGNCSCRKPASDVKSETLRTGRKVSPAMSDLQGYYGLKLKDKNRTISQVIEMAVYKNGDAKILEDGAVPLGFQRKSKSLDCFMTESSEFADSETVFMESREGDSDKLIRRRQKSEPVLGSQTPETLLNDNGNGNYGISARGNRSGLRQKVPSRTSMENDDEASCFTPIIPIGLGDCIIAEDLFGSVKKSPSAASLQDQEGRGNSIMWPTSNWNFKPDLLAKIQRLKNQLEEPQLLNKLISYKLESNIFNTRAEIDAGSGGMKRISCTML